MKTLSIGVLIGILSCGQLHANASATAPAVADTTQQWYQAAQQFKQHNQFKQAFTQYQKAAQQGHAQAQWQLAWLYRQGRGTAENYAMAAHWFAQAAQQDVTGAAFYAGLMHYYLGDTQQALRWYFKASEQDDVEAHIRLADLYLRSAIPLPSVNVNPQRLAREYYQKAAPVDFEWYKDAAYDGDVDAQIRLAQLYEYGTGVQQSFRLAIEWYEKAAAQNLSYAQFQLGMHYYLDGNAARGVKWFRKAAQQNYAHAQFYLGIMYAYGSGVEGKDIGKALYWFKQAASRDADYADKLGMMFADGTLVEQDSQKAIKWHSEFAQQDAQRLYQLAQRYHYGQQVHNNPKQALHWYQQAADQGSLAATFWLAFFHAKGLLGLQVNPTQAEQYYQQLSRHDYSLKQELSLSPYKHYPDQLQHNVAQALQWLQHKADNADNYAQYILAALANEQKLEKYLKSAQQGHIASQLALSRLYNEGRNGIPRNPEQTIYWLKQAAKQGNPVAQHQLALTYRLGTHQQQADHNTAIYWYQQLANNDNRYAQLMLGYLYLQQTSDNRSLSQALSWFKKAAQHNSFMAQYQLGKLYAEGKRLPQDLAQAAYWLKQAKSNYAAAEALWQHYQLHNHDKS